MTTCRVAFELPGEFVAGLGPANEVAARAKEAFVPELLRQAQIGQSKAAELLAITREDLLGLMGHYQVSSGLAAGEDVNRELETARNLGSTDTTA